MPLLLGGEVTDTRTAHLLLAALDHDAEHLPAAVLSSHDPFQVLRYANALDTPIRDAIGDRLTAAEIDAVQTAPSTPGAAEAITALRRAGHTVTVVSNNSEVAVSLYLAQHGLAEHIAGINARTSSDPALLKPHPHLLHAAIRARSTRAESCVLIGDSVTDVEAAHAAGVPCIGYCTESAPHPSSRP